MLLFYLSLIDNEEDKSKFEMLYNKYRKLLKYIAVESLKDEYLAEDAVHEAFIKLTRYIKGVDDVDSHKTKAFVVIIVKSFCKDMIRKDKCEKTVALEEVDNLSHTNHDAFKNIEFEYIYKAIESLSDKYREIIEQHIMFDQVHLLLSILPKTSVVSFKAHLKGGSVLMTFDKHANLNYKFGNRHYGQNDIIFQQLA